MRRHFWIVLLGGGVILGSLVLEPSGPYQMRLPGTGPFPEISPFHAVTGMPGPTCGLTRSFTNTAHLQLVNGFKAHMLGPVMFFGLLGVWASSLRKLVIFSRAGSVADSTGRRTGDDLQNIVNDDERPPDRWRPFIIPTVSVFLITWLAKLLLGWY